MSDDKYLPVYCLGVVDGSRRQKTAAAVSDDCYDSRPSRHHRRH